MRGIAAAAAAVTIVALMALPAAAQEQGVGAEIVDFAFAPVELTVDAGTRVTWTNEGARPHTVTDRGGTFDTKPIPPGAQERVTFSAPGRYYVFCRINPSRMNGIVTVNPDPNAPVARVQATDPAREGDQLSFDPPSLRVQTGTTISFANVGGKPHTLTADDGSFDTGVVTPGAENGRFAGNNATVTLNRPGTFPFHCEVHPAAMKGTLTVVGPERQAAAAAASDAPRAVTVDVLDFSFDPVEASVAPAGRLNFTNRGDASHTATFDDVELDTGNIASGEEGELTAPDEPGSYSYRCTIHPARMRGVLVVVGQNTPDPVAQTVATRGGGGGSDGSAPLSALVLGTGVVGAFFGGMGIAGFLAGRRRKSPPPPSEPDPEAAA